LNLLLSLLNLVVPIGNRPEHDIIESQVDHSNEHVDSDEKFSQKAIWSPNNSSLTLDVESFFDILYWQNESKHDSDKDLDATPY